MQMLTVSGFLSKMSLKSPFAFIVDPEVKPSL
jgi:hypothetical protein